MSSPDDLSHWGDLAAKAGPFLSSKVGRFLQGAAEPIVGAGQFAAHATGLGEETMDKLAQRQHDVYQASRREAGLKPEDWDWWGGAGNIASPVNLGVAGAVGRGIRAGGMLGAALRGSAAGAAAGATMPVVDPTKGSYGGQKEGQILAGAGTGAVLGPAGEFVAGAVAPHVLPEARMLAAEGVELTPGQMGGRGWKYWEDIASRVPGLGAYVREAQERAYTTFNRAAARRALAPLGDPEFTAGLDRMRNGYEMAEYVREVLGSQYELLHAGMALEANEGLEMGLMNLITQARRELTPEHSATFTRIVDNQLNRKVFQAPNQTIDGATIQGVTSELGEHYAGYMASASHDERQLGRMVNELRSLFDEELMQQNPGYAQALRRVNRGWESFVRFRKASGSTSSQAREGTFTPHQYGVAVNQADKSLTRKGEGRALGQDLAVAGRRLLPSSIPNSGTPERTLALGLLGGTATVSPQAALMAALIPAIYSRPGQAILRRAIMDRPAGADYVSELLRRYAPVQGTQGYLGLSNQGE